MASTVVAQWHKPANDAMPSVAPPSCVASLSGLSFELPRPKPERSSVGFAAADAKPPEAKPVRPLGPLWLPLLSACSGATASCATSCAGGASRARCSACSGSFSSAAAGSACTTGGSERVSQACC